MFRKQDFKKVDLLGSGKKNTKIYKAEHIPTGKYYALKEVEAKTLEKLNEYKVSFYQFSLIRIYSNRRKQYSCSKSRTIRMFCNFMDITSMKLCTTHSELQWFVSTWIPGPILNISSGRENSRIYSGLKRN